MYHTCSVDALRDISLGPVLVDIFQIELVLVKLWIKFLGQEAEDHHGDRG